MFSLWCSFIMLRFTLPGRLEIVKKYYRNSGSVLSVQREFTRELGRHHRLVRRIFAASWIIFAAASIEDDHRMSIRHRSAALGIAKTTTHRILRLDLCQHPYKMVLTQKLKPEDHRMRREFADWALSMLDDNPNFGQTIIFSDEAHFWLNGYVNKQNCRYWSDHQPQIFERLTVWCGLLHGGIIGPYFFRNEAGATATVNGNRYRTMLTEFLWPELDSIDITNMWFQQDGATCHTSGETMELLKEKFGE